MKGNTMAHYMAAVPDLDSDDIFLVEEAPECVEMKAAEDRRVLRQTAASRSARHWIREQHGSTGGVPRVMLSKPPSTLEYTPSLRASLGHLVGFGLGLGLGEGQEPHALTREKKRMLSAKNRARKAALFYAMAV
ncbi:hypothetical protein F3Y22_tig00110347pilonHSYRG00006 [Hibiscus syriacus]|uniref:Uncharacterized protein n=1 Tax=Hibiscus syriacus TaxID=106335 RepID=A0A6A3AXU5_HIBSY|nr:hypothetical protein F3Y22_tig00110347pilonHSYRG00006 [Hibiscus syriacus]